LLEAVTARGAIKREERFKDDVGWEIRREQFETRDKKDQRTRLGDVVNLAINLIEKKKSAKGCAANSLLLKRRGCRDRSSKREMGQVKVGIAVMWGTRGDGSRGKRGEPRRVVNYFRAKGGGHVRELPIALGQPAHKQRGIALWNFLRN